MEPKAYNPLISHTILSNNKVILKYKNGDKKIIDEKDLKNSVPVRVYHKKTFKNGNSIEHITEEYSDGSIKELTLLNDQIYSMD